MIYRIYPPIGVARLGNSASEFFIGAESPDSNGTEIKADGTETEVVSFKTGDTGDPDTSFQVKRQAARFRIYEFDDEQSPGRPAVLPPQSVVEWSVHLINKKDAVRRPPTPPASPIPVQAVNGRENRIIDAGKQQIRTGATSDVVLQGTYLGNNVVLGELRLDKAGNLLVLGGLGISATFENADIGNDFYNNPNWHDDVADGPVTARIIQADGTPIDVQGAWIVTAPPDFAPGVKGMVTLYDRILQSALTAAPPLATMAVQPSFTRDILPLIKRARGLRWVHDNAAWQTISSNFAQLSDTSAAAATRRRNVVRAIRIAETEFDHPDYDFRLCDWQNQYLTRYMNGDFIADFGTAPPVDPLEPSVLTRTVLDGTVGEGLFPGIEAGMILNDMSVYTTPFSFRLDHSKVNPGDLTALMAQPWQADFRKCANGWWPTQRPNQVPGTNPRLEWDRGIGNHQDLVDHVMKLGMITQKQDGGGQEVFEEQGRTLP